MVIPPYIRILGEDVPVYVEQMVKVTVGETTVIFSEVEENVACENQEKEKLNIRAKMFKIFSLAYQREKERREKVEESA